MKLAQYVNSIKWSTCEAYFYLKVRSLLLGVENVGIKKIIMKKEVI